MTLKRPISNSMDLISLLKMHIIQHQKRQKGIYEVVDIGYDHYQNDKTKSKQHFIKLKTLNKGG